MWVDYNDKIMDNIFVNVKKSKNVPYLCEVCNNKSVHLYMHIYNNTTKRGGCGFGVVLVILFGIVLFMFHQVGKIAHW